VQQTASLDAAIDQGQKMSKNKNLHNLLRGRLHLRFGCAVWMCVLPSHSLKRDFFIFFDTENDIENASKTHQKRIPNLTLSKYQNHAVGGVMAIRGEGSHT
jgi:hypothetical protein